MAEEKGSSSFIVCTYFYNHLILLLKIGNSKLTATGRWLFVVFFFLLYLACRVAENSLVNIGSKMHCSKTMQK